MDWNMMRMDGPYFDGEVVDAVHVEVLDDLEVLHFSLVAAQALVVGVPDLDALLPHLGRHLVLVEHALRQQVLRHQQARLHRRFVVVAVLRGIPPLLFASKFIRKMCHTHRFFGSLTYRFYLLMSYH